MSPVEAVLAATVVAGLSGVPGLFFPAGRREGELSAVVMLWLAAALAGWGVVAAFSSLEPSQVSWRWPIPGGAFSARLDALAGLFLVPVFLVSSLGATYGLEYWREREHPQNGRRLRLVYGLMVAGLAGVMVAQNAIVFLGFWEVMALAAFIAVGTEDHLAEARAASGLYLVVTRASTLALFAMFALLHAATGTFELVPVPAAALTPAASTAVFLLALFGFGVKAGVMPGHVWLPGAHAAAPSHVSAMMSGVLIKVGIYGLLRILTLLPAAPAWWGVTLLVAGAVSGVLGVAVAIGQHDLKRLLAYHSVENIGIIVMGVAVATLGRTAARPELVVLGLAGALLHVWNHGLFKSLLFFSAGAVVHGCHTRELDQLGGLSRRMPWVSAAFLLGAVAICGLPPLNGFVSELFIYLGLFGAAQAPAPFPWLPAALAAPALALIGGLAAACFVKAYGAAFLGTPRSEAARTAHQPGALMLWPMAALASGCVVIGLLPMVASPVLEGCVRAVAPESFSPLSAHAPLTAVSLASLGLLAALLGGWWLYRSRLTRASLAEDATWGCGYAAPTERMQYSSSSFAELLVGNFSWALWPREHRAKVTGQFPPAAAYSSHVGDTVLDRLLQPFAFRVAAVAGWLHWMQAGNLRLYLAFVGAALLVALTWLQGVP